MTLAYEAMVVLIVFGILAMDTIAFICYEKLGWFLPGGRLSNPHALLFCVALLFAGPLIGGTLAGIAWMRLFKGFLNRGEMLECMNTSATHPLYLEMNKSLLDRFRPQRGQGTMSTSPHARLPFGPSGNNLDT